MRASARSFAIVSLLALGPGCASRNDCPPAACNAAVERQFDCREVERQALVPDVSLVPPAGMFPAGSEQKLCALSEQTAQCLAARYATTANLLVQEAEAVAAQPSHGGARKNGAVRSSQVLLLEAAQKRNTAAANALEAFLRLIQAEAGSDNLRRRTVELDGMLADVGAMQERGLLPPAPKPEILSQKQQVLHRQADVAASVQKLNFQLQEMLDIDLAPNSRFWPEASLTVTLTSPDKDQTVNFALANRADLAAVRLATDADESGSVAAARTVLQLAGGGLGSANPPAGLLASFLHPAARNSQGSARSEQLAEMLADRRRTVVHETLEALVVLETRVVQVGLTRRRLELLREHLRATTEQQTKVAGLPLNVRKVRLDVIAAEQDLLDDVIEWKLAVVKLKAAQGLLAIECGCGAAAGACSQSPCGP